MATINQKEYLKKYLGIGKAPGEKKKKKKKEKSIWNKLKIIDDDADAFISQEIQDDISAANEDAPQIVAVIDERPPSLRIDEQTKSNLWAPIGESSNIDPNTQSLKLSNSFKLSKQTKSNYGKKIYDKHQKVKIEQRSPKRSQNESNYSPPKLHIKSSQDLPLRKGESDFNYSTNNSAKGHSPPLKRHRDDGQKDSKDDYDDSPPRRRNRKGSMENDNSPLSKRKGSYSPSRESISPLPVKGRDVDDNSPPRRRNNYDSSPPSRKHGDYSPTRKRENIPQPKKGSDVDDNSPPRRKNKYNSSPQRRKYDDYSPTGRNRENILPLPKKGSDMDDNSPPRRKNNKYDSSPPRRKHGDATSLKERSRDDMSPPRRKYEADNSPQRRKNKIDDSSPSRKRHELGDTSPPRRKRNNEDISPPRMRVKIEEIDKSPPRKNRRAEDKKKKSRWGKWSPEASPERPGNSEEKLKKTLDGKKAGLQDAKDLVKETTILRRKEDEMFKKLSAEVSGMNAATVVRRKELRDLEEEAKQRDIEKKTKEKYDRWGKGLKQVDDQNERIADQLHEMSKPLARYADDEDLEKYLKEQERDGDPMLAYIRKKKKKQSAVAGTSEKPEYLGEFMPNRFGIRPGYRWDGVDRSNGYEMKWFQVQNSKRANLEEAFKWSTEDM